MAISIMSVIRSFSARYMLHPDVETKMASAISAATGPLERSRMYSANEGRVLISFCSVLAMGDREIQSDQAWRLFVLDINRRQFCYIVSIIAKYETINAIGHGFSGVSPEDERGISGPVPLVQFPALHEFRVTRKQERELRSPTRESFTAAEGDEPRITIAAAYAKNRRQDTLPLIPGFRQYAATIRPLVRWPSVI